MSQQLANYIVDGAGAILLLLLSYVIKGYVVPLIVQYHLSSVARQVVQYIEQTMSGEAGHQKLEEALAILKERFPWLPTTVLEVAIESAVHDLKPYFMRITNKGDVVPDVEPANEAPAADIHY